ncbi:MAG: hypothetical protein ACYSSO_14515 [Planctomycetota bacterium]|jgi:hypothetical protein
MKNAFVIGNGLSRKGWDLTQLRGKGLRIGCNSIHRDFMPDVLVATDKKIVDKMLDFNGVTRILKTEGYWRLLQGPYKLEHFEPIKQSREISLSGQIGILVADMQPSTEKIYLLGFDFFHADQEAKKCNMYTKAELLRPKNYHEYLNKFINRIEAKTIRVGPLGDPMLPLLDMDLMTYQQFERVLCTTD